ncbi:MAG: hypothetical protein ACI4JW_03590 [Oscillospiraceae bacterium]
MIKNEEIIARYSDAEEIWTLMRSKKLTAKEHILDTAVALLSPLPGIVNEADAFADMGTYILVVKQDAQLLVRIEKGEFEEQDVTGQCEGKKFTVGQNKFLKVKNING